MTNIKVNWQGHTFSVHNHEANWADVPGIYIFSGFNQQRQQWIPLYIGQAESFKNRLSSHERWAEARKHGATHVHAMRLTQQTERNNVEKQLIQSFQPRLNTLLK